MSSVYMNQPPTNGKMILHSSQGDIEIELWPKEAPLTCRNFIQLSLEGAYSATPFHRLVKGFILQGGDPTGTGTGGQAVYEGGVFGDEFHSRLRFAHRGVVAMANSVAGENRSQFFITLDATPELNGRYTIFGKVVGDTIYNVMKIAEGQVMDDGSERPMYPAIVRSVTVVSNPFTDIKPREGMASLLSTRVVETVNDKRVRARGRKAVNNVKLLSFEDESDNFNIPVSRKKIKSAHEVLQDDRRLRGAVTNDQVPVDVPSESKQTKQEAPKLDAPELALLHRKELSEDGHGESAVERLRREIIDKNPAPKITHKTVDKKPKALTPLEQEQQKFLLAAKGNQKVILAGRKSHQSEEDVLKRLAKFQNKLKSSAPIENKKEYSLRDEICVLHSIPNCQSCLKSVTSNNDKVSNSEWMSHTLAFDKDFTGKDLLDPKTRRMDNLEELDVIDPRDRMSKIQASSKKSREWDQRKPRNIL